MNVEEEVAAKINTIMATNESVDAACVEELLATWRLQRRTPMYFFACVLLAHKRYQDMLSIVSEADEKF